MTAVHVLASGANRSGGADVYTADLAARLTARGFDLTLICFQADEPATSGVRVLRVGRGTTNELPLIWRLSPLLQLRDVTRSLRSHRAAPPDVVIGMAHQLIWAHGRVYGPLPLVYLPHSLVAPLEVAGYRWHSDLKRATAIRVWDRLEVASLNRAFRTVRFSEAACEALTSYYGARIHPRFEVIPLAIDLPPVIDRSRRGPVRLLAVGRLVSSKGIDALLRLAAGLRATNWQLDILGDGEERPALESLASSAALRDRVRFHGHCDPGPFYAQADLLVLPSLLESASLVLLEAMAHGVPCLGFRADGVRYRNANHELITADHDGFLAADEAAFGTTLERLISAPDLLESAGRHARETVARRHTWSAHLDAWTRLLMEASRTRPTEPPAGVVIAD